jgi:hypothetical protein
LITSYIFCATRSVAGIRSRRQRLAERRGKARRVHRDRIGTEQPERLQVHRIVDDAQLQSLAVRWLLHRADLVDDVAAAQQEIAQHLEPGAIAHARNILPDLAIERCVQPLLRGDHVRQRERVDGFHEAGVPRRHGHGHRQRPGLHRLQHLGNAAELRTWKDLDLHLAGGKLGEFVAEHHDGLVMDRVGGQHVPEPDRARLLADGWGGESSA